MFLHLAISRETFVKFIKIETYFSSSSVSRNATINGMLNIHTISNKRNHLKSRTNARKSSWRLSFPVSKPEEHKCQSSANIWA